METPVALLTRVREWTTPTWALQAPQRSHFEILVLFDGSIPTQRPRALISDTIRHCHPSAFFTLRNPASFDVIPPCCVPASQDTETPDGLTIIYSSSTHYLFRSSQPPSLSSYVQNRSWMIQGLLQRTMEPSDSRSRNASADGQLTRLQAELLVLLQKLVTKEIKFE